MKAIQIHEPGDVNVLKFEDVREPNLGSGEILIKLRAAALNHRDLSIRKREKSRSMFPLIPGSDGAGVIAGVGPDTPAWSAGDHVIINPALNWNVEDDYPGSDFKILGGPDHGTYAEYIVVPMENVYPKPGPLSFHEAAACPVGMLTAWRALQKIAEVRPGDNVFLPGIGSGVGTFALQIAKLAGAEVYVTSHDDTKIERAIKLGASAGFNYLNEDWVKKIRESTNGYGLDIILDSVGHPTLSKGLSLLTNGGRLVTYGATGGPEIGLNVRKLYQRHLRLFGTTLGSPVDFKNMLIPLSTGKIRPVIDRVYSLKDAQMAQLRLESAAQFGKIVLDID